MCPIDLTVEEKEVLEDVEEVPLEEKEEDSKVEEEEVSEEDLEFEGVEKVEDIPKGKEKDYGI